MSPPPSALGDTGPRVQLSYPRRACRAHRVPRAPTPRPGGTLRVRASWTGHRAACVRRGCQTPPRTLTWHTAPARRSVAASAVTAQRCPRVKVGGGGMIPLVHYRGWCTRQGIGSGSERPGNYPEHSTRASYRGSPRRWRCPDREDDRCRSQLTVQQVGCPADTTSLYFQCGNAT